MGAFETLTKLLGALSPDLDVTFGDDVDIGDVDEESEVRIKTESPGEKAHLTGETVYLYPEQLQGEEYVLFQKFVREAKRDEGEVVRADEKDETKALENTETVEIDDTIQFFDGVISDRHVSILRSALYLRTLSESDDPLPDFDVGQKKRDIAEKYGYESYYMIHLASSGYFDEGRYFRELYHELETESDSTLGEYRDEFEEIIGEKLIGTFVNADDTTYDVKSDVKAGIAKHFRYRPPADFFDVCGMGHRCKVTIDGAVEDLERDYEEMQYDDENRNEERVVRIFPETIRGFGIE